MIHRPLPIDEMIHGDKFAAFADVEINSGVDEVIVRRGLELIGEKPIVFFVKTDYLEEAFNLIGDSQNHGVILITHNSDWPITEDIFRDAPSCVVKWFALNVAYEHKCLIPIPSGMERPKGGGYSAHPEVIAEYDGFTNRKNQIFSCMNVNNNFCARQPVLDHFKKFDNLILKNHGTSFEEFIRCCTESRFVLSPEGNGIDCHRTWEAIYCGAIPIVQRSAHTQRFHELPLLLVEDWSVINQQVLDFVWVGYQDTKLDYSKATMSYWVNRITKEKANLR